MDHNRVQKFTIHPVQMFSQITFKDFKTDILSVLNSNAIGNYLSGSHRINGPLTRPIDDKSLRLWRLASPYTLKKAFDYMKEACGKSSSYDYRIVFPGKYLENFSEKKMEEINVRDTDFVFVEWKEPGRNCDFQHSDVPKEEKCFCCYKYAFLNYSCGCKKVLNFINHSKFTDFS